MYISGLLKLKIFKTVLTWLDRFQMRPSAGSSPWCVGWAVPVDSSVHKSGSSRPWSCWPGSCHGTRSACSQLSPPVHQNSTLYINSHHPSETFRDNATCTTTMHFFIMNLLVLNAWKFNIHLSTFQNHNVVKFIYSSFIRRE